MARVKVRVGHIDAGRVRIEGVESELRRGPFKQYIDRKGVRVLQAAQRLAPVSKIVPRPPYSTMPPQNPGRLKRSLFARQGTTRGLPSVDVGTKGVDYATYVIQGTPPHIIRARHKKTLAFWTGAGFAYPRQVMHPGTRPNDFLSRALREAGY